MAHRESEGCAEALTLPFLTHSDWRSRISCWLWGHHVHNGRFKQSGGPRFCRCGARYLAIDGTYTRVRHTLSCFFAHHTYERLAERDGHHEYVCLHCGHPLVFTADSDPYATAARFTKKVRYLCGVFGHRVHRVAARHGFVEHACHCGHSFLKDEHALAIVRHPLVCVAAGHFVRYVASRGGYAEYVCRNCGHPFCFAESRDF
jgi:hypothetical protein